MHTNFVKTMRKELLCMGLLLSLLTAKAQSLLPDGVKLDEHTFLVNPSAPVAANFVFHSLKEALEQVTDGTEAKPMTVYIAPDVYWMDDPDDLTIRKPEVGEGTPYAQKVNCNWLRLVGLSSNPEDVVIACNRGQTQGAMGNYTMFFMGGDGISAENITFGNYCNVDLVYPRDTTKNRKKREEAIVQAQLVLCNGDKLVLRNCRFISRLNCCPFVGGKRTLFDGCYFECTDDALCGTGLYMNCTFTFFSSKPFYSTAKTGAVFLNCDINLKTKGTQNFTKAGGQVALVNCRFYADNPVTVNWTPYPSESLRGYQSNVSFNGEPYYINSSKPELTVVMDSLPLLRAYCFNYKNSLVYNSYNLLQGDDEWDPLNCKSAVTEIEKETGLPHSGLPVFLGVRPSKRRIVTQEEGSVCTVELLRMGGYKTNFEAVRLFLNDTTAAKMKLLDEASCRVVSVLDKDNSETVLLKASHQSGLETSCILELYAQKIEPPSFVNKPTLKPVKEGAISVDYSLDLGGREDYSLITWYRCSDTQGSNPVPVSVSRLNSPEYSYRLSPGDAGCYIMVEVKPKHIRCDAGEPLTAVTAFPIKKEDVVNKNIFTDFQNFPAVYQPLVMPGYWTVDGYKPVDTQAYDWQPRNDSWAYGAGYDGAKGTGLYQTARGARLRYTPVEGVYGDMTVTLSVDPFKTAGQGFGSATAQYMDIYIKFDTKTLTGYALRIIRTPKNDKAVDFLLVQYDKGIVTPITEAVTSSCYRSGCNIVLSVKANQLTAEASSPLSVEDTEKAAAKVFLQAAITPSSLGGTGLQHTGSAGASATMLHSFSINYE